MRIGKLRHRITIQEKSVTQDEYNAEVISWVDVVKAWASVEPYHLEGEERIAAQQVYGEVTTLVTLRYQKSITPAMRVLFGSRIFAIAGTLCPDEKYKELRLYCKEEV